MSEEVIIIGNPKIEIISSLKFRLILLLLVTTIAFGFSSLTVLFFISSILLISLSFSLRQTYRSQVKRIRYHNGVISLDRDLKTTSIEKYDAFKFIENEENNFFIVIQDSKIIPLKKRRWDNFESFYEISRKDNFYRRHKNFGKKRFFLVDIVDFIQSWF